MNLCYGKIAEISERFGSEFYILKMDEFAENVSGFKKSFEKHYRNFNIGYSYKTNYIPYVCRKANELGLYAEVVSELEIDLARKIGVYPENIIYNGPGKTKASIEYGL